MYSKVVEKTGQILALTTLFVVTAAGPLPEVHYSPAGLVSPQAFLHHEPLPNFATSLVASPPVTQLLHTSPLSYTPITNQVITPVHKVAAGREEFVHQYPRYEFSYSVADDQTGDHKSHHEVSDQGVVRGEYTMQEADGTIRKVEYTADDQNGFNAVVSHHHHKLHPHPQPHTQPLILN